MATSVLVELGKALLQGGPFYFTINTENVQVAEVLKDAAVRIVEKLSDTAVTLSAIYVGYQLLKNPIDAAVKSTFGGPRDDQDDPETGSGSLHVLLRCLTDKRFLEVLADYESGRIKQRLQEELSQVGIEVEGLKIEIENMEEVNKIKAAINERSSYPTKMMTESEEKKTKKTDSLVSDESELSSGNNQGFQMVFSKEHGNWLTVGELIRSIQKPISVYADEIVQAFHEKLCQDLLPVGKCRSPEDCNKKTRPSDLCQSCKRWFRKLKDSHENGNNPSWHKNCKSAEWSEDHWEVAKFFMPALGSKLSTVKDAQSTDLSSLLIVLEWMKDGAFLGKTRVNVDLVRKLRSQVRNTWVYAPQQKLTNDETAESFSIAIDFLEDLEKVWSNAVNRRCLEHLENLKTNTIANVIECELQSLLSQRHLLNDIRDEITEMKVEISSDKKAIEKAKTQQEKQKNLERAINEWNQRMSDFKRFKENINKQFINFAEELEHIRAVPQVADVL